MTIVVVLIMEEVVLGYHIFGQKKKTEGSKVVFFFSKKIQFSYCTWSWIGSRFTLEKLSRNVEFPVLEHIAWLAIINHMDEIKVCNIQLPH